MWRRRDSLHWRTVVGGWRLVPIIAGVAVFATACVGMSTTDRHSTQPDTTVALPTSSASSTTPTVTPSASASTTVPPSTSAVPSTSVAPRPATTTSCASIVHIGDSTSVGLISPDFLPDPKQRVTAQYTRVGATNQKIEIDGGTSVLETAVAGAKNAHEVAQQIVAGGYNGCWMIALGTNDTADVYVGSALNLAGRINEMMATIGKQPVVWLTAKTLRSSGPYANANMKKWNQALLSACAKYPNMRVFDWASIVQTAWFGSDQIHYTTAGYAQRARLIADSLVHAFPGPPGTPPSSSCVVH